MKISYQSKSNTSAKTLVVFASDSNKLTDAAKDLDKKVSGTMKKAAKSEDFKGKLGESVIINAPTGVKRDKIILIGVGKELTKKNLETVGSKLFTLLNAKSSDVEIIADIKDKKLSEAEIAVAIATGLKMNSYRFNKHFTKTKKAKEIKVKSVQFTLKDVKTAKKLFTREDKVVEGTFLARDLVNEAPNILYPEAYAKIIKKELAPLGIKVTVLGRSQIKKLGMGAMHSVGQASDREEKLVIMEYKGGKKTQKNIAFVGKGITFDTGGYSLKPGSAMTSMKMDMGGSAAVVGLMKALAGRKAKANVIGVAALAENMIAGNASRPDDVVKSMSGQTIEILNTDAEGRLVLADAMWYVQEKYKPTHMIDTATLTGAILVALGHEYAGAFSNDDDMAQDLIKASKEANQPMWYLPMCDAWDKELNSDIADMRNIGQGRGAGSATAAHFLKRFVKPETKWLHLDIAGMAWQPKPKDCYPKGASGYGVRLFDKYVEKFFEK